MYLILAHFVGKISQYTFSFLLVHLTTIYINLGFTGWLGYLLFSNCVIRPFYRSNIYPCRSSYFYLLGDFAFNNIEQNRIQTTHHLILQENLLKQKMDNSVNSDIFVFLLFSFIYQQRPVVNYNFINLKNTYHVPAKLTKVKSWMD